jgi:hypothetical protein
VGQEVPQDQEAPQDLVRLFHQAAPPRNNGFSKQSMLNSLSAVLPALS